MRNSINNILEFIKAYWLFLIPHYIFSRITFIITRTKNPLVPSLIKLYIKFSLYLNLFTRSLLIDKCPWCKSPSVHMSECRYWSCLIFDMRSISKSPYLYGYSTMWVVENRPVDVTVTLATSRMYERNVFMSFRRSAPSSDNIPQEQLTASPVAAFFKRSGSNEITSGDCISVHQVTR